MAKYLVTGGAGFIGSHVIELLVAKGHSVRVVDDLSTGHLKNLEPYRAALSKDQFEFFKRDISLPGSLSSLTEGIDHVIHLAAEVSVTHSVLEPERTRDINVEATRRLLEASVLHNVKSFVFASSCAVYGNATDLPIGESTPPQPVSPYAESKLEAERLASQIRSKSALATVNFRFFNVFGPRQDPASPYAAAIPIFIKRLSEGLPPTVFGDGKQTRDFIFVRDIAKALVWSCENAEWLKEPVYNLCSGVAMTVNELITTLSRYVRTTAQPVYAASRIGEVLYSQGNPNLFVQATRKQGWEYQPTAFELGIVETVNYYLGKTLLPEAVSSSMPRVSNP